MKERVSSVPMPAMTDITLDSVTAIDPATLAALDLMTHAELIALIRRVSGAMWGYAMMTPEQTAEAMKLKLASGGLTERDMYKALPLMREWMDRSLGKAVTPIAAKFQDVDKDKPRMTTAEAARKVQFLLAMAEDEKSANP